MATEATADQSVENIVPSDSEPSNKTPNDLNDVASHAPDVNGSAAASTDELERKQISDIVDDLVNSAEVSISGGSDTEASKLDGLKGKDGDKGHGRTSSSVKKPATFKAVSVNKTFLAAKGAAGTAATKTADKSPLSASLTVAQPGSLSAARPRLVAKTGSGHSLPKAVGANGRAPAAPDPNAVWNKNRPAPPPEPKKFTDEELKKYGIHMASRLHPDDSKGQANWADIEDDDEDWAPEEIRWNDGTKSTIPHHEEQPAPTPEPPASSVSRELKTADKPKSPTPTASPSVKPGVLASGKGLVLKGHQDKPTLVAKPPAPPTPVKSPWATLPPVDKAPPPIDLPGQHHPMRPPPREHHMQYGDGMLGPYKEIAADDFSRSGFRDGHAAHGRELFNSHSGRLEPVMDRRGGVRSEAHGRQPPAALLQRPSQSDHPEPSAAFQTSRTSAQEGPYGRRRGSSNVSGGSGHVFSRMGKPHDQALPPPELLSARRASTAAGSDDMSSPRNFSPSGQRQPMHGLPAWQTRMSPNVTHATPFTGHQMAQNENNAHLPGQQLPPAVPVEDALEVQKRVMRERREMAIKRRLEEEAREEAAKQERLRVKLEALGPAPERKSTKKEVSNENTLKDTSRSHSKSSDAETAEVQSTPHQPRSMQPSASAESNSDTLPDGAKPHGQHQPIHPPGLADSVHAAQESKAAPGWQSQGERLPTWAPASQPSSRNVWGSPNNNRSLGNGTFNADLGRVPDAFTGAAPQVHSKPTPGPIGPPGSQKQSMAPIQPIGPPNANAVRNAWSSAVRDRDSTLFAERQAARAEQQRDMEARGLSAQDLKTSIKDNWKPTKLNDEGIRIEERERSTVIHAAAPWKTSDDATTVTQTQSHGLQHTPPLGPNGPGAVPQQGRASRFFPTRDVRLEEQAARADRSGRNSPSPPPPDMFGHPVFDGDAARPHVALPPPQIVVRLPKTQSAHAHNAEWATQQAPRGLPPRGPMREAHMQHEGLYQPNQAHAVPHPDNPWQARIDHLLDRKPSSPPKSASVDSVSRVVDHRAYQQYPATVSLPFSFSKNLDQGVDGSVTSKVMAEECFEEQEMGSLPSVRLGTDYPPHLDDAVEAPKPLPRRFLLTTSTSLDQDQLLRDGFGPQHIAPIRLPGSPTAKSVTIPVPRSRSNPRRPGGYNRGGMRHSSAAVHRGGKSREPSSSYGEGTTGSSGRGRGGYRGRSDNWSRHVSSPLQT